MPNWIGGIQQPFGAFKSGAVPLAKGLVSVTTTFKLIINANGDMMLSYMMEKNRGAEGRLEAMMTDFQKKIPGLTKLMPSL